MSLKNELNDATENEQLREALRRALQNEAKLKRRTDDLVEAIYRGARDAALASGRPKPLPKIKRDRRSSRGEIALIHTTDYQAGKKTTTFDLGVLRSRIDLFTEKVIHLTDIQRAHHPVREAVLMIGGDMVEGLTVFPGQSYEVEAHLFEQLFEVTTILEAMIRKLAANFETFRVVCEFGNHGRIGRKGDLPYADNIDRMAYRIVEDKVKDLNIGWQASENFYQLVKVGDAYRALLFHGDEVNSYGGAIPAYGIIKKVSAWASGVLGESFTDAYCGHFHSVMTLPLPNGGRVFVTGSPESDNTYAKAFVAATSRPSQRLHFIDSEKPRVTAEYVVWLD